MSEINLIDPSLQNYYNKTNISIQLSLDGFSFAIYSVFDLQLRAFRNYKFENIILQEDLLNATNDVLSKDDLLRLPHQQAKIIYTDRKSTLLPNEFLDKENIKSLLEFNHPIDDLDEIHINSIERCNSNLIFTVPTYFASLMAEKFKNLKFYNQASSLIQKCLKDFTSENRSKVFIQLNKDFFDLIILKEGELKLYNSFLYADANDLLYFILYACKQLKVDVKSSDIYLLGEYSGNPAIIKEIDTYIKTQKPWDSFKDDPFKHFLNLDQQRFYTLLNLSHCE